MARTKQSQNGEMNGNAKLSAGAVKIIRDTVKYLGCNKDLAKHFNVSRPTISLIRQGHRWRTNANN